MPPDIIGIYRTPAAGSGQHRVRVQDTDGREWTLTPQEYADRGYQPDAESLPMVDPSRPEGST